MSLSKLNDVRNFDQLACWQQSTDLACACYRLAKLFPKYEERALCAQLRRAATSVPATIAEGFGRGTQRDFARFLYMARGSLLEAESHLLFAQKVGYLRAEDLANVFRIRLRAGRSLNGLIARIHSQSRHSLPRGREPRGVDDSRR